MSDEDKARCVADIIGPQSAAAQALAELERRRASGEVVVLFAQGRSWFVGPPASIERAQSPHQADA